MIPVKQEFDHNPALGIYGDCHRAAIATLLSLPLAEVPHFGEGDPSAEIFYDREREFLSRHGTDYAQCNSLWMGSATSHPCWT